MSFSLASGRGFGQEIVDAGLGSDGRGGQAVVAGDHHGLDAHAAQFGEAFLNAALDDVLQLDHAQHAACRSATTSGVLPRLAIRLHASLCICRAMHRRVL